MSRALSRGFSLIEVVVAIALFSIALIALNQAFIGGMRGMIALEELDAQDAEMQVFHKYLRGLAKKEQLEAGGDFRLLSGKTLSWKASVQALEKDALDVYAVEVTTESDGESSVETLYIYNMNWADAKVRTQEISEKKKKEARRP